jgi:hypothetical protein
MDCRVPHVSPLLRDVGIPVQSGIPREMQTASESPRPLREPINRYPVKVTIIIETTPPEIKLL